MRQAASHAQARAGWVGNAGPDPHQVQDVGRLELAHNGCVDALRRLLSKRLELVQLMFGADTLKADWEQELSHLTDARLSLLVERREMVGALDGQPTRASFYKRHPEERGR